MSFDNVSGWRVSTRLLVLALLLMPAAGSIQARELKVVFSSYTPPYVFQGGNEARPGILVDIVQQAFAGTDYTIKPVFLPLGRGFKLLEEKKIDVISISRRRLGVKAFYSDYSIAYHNFAIGLESRRMPIEQVSDLKGRSIIAFQKADVYLGDEFKAAIAGNPDYIEMANQENQVHMLLKGRIDIAVMDRSIFEFYRNKLVNEGQVSPDVKAHFYNLFEPSRYRAAFADEQVRDQFNRGLKRLREAGGYEAIYDKYLRDYFVFRH